MLVLYHALGHLIGKLFIRFQLNIAQINKNRIIRCLTSIAFTDFTRLADVYTDEDGSCAGGVIRAEAEALDGEIAEVAITGPVRTGPETAEKALGG